MVFLNKGLQEEGGPPFELPILDAVYICKAHRRQGWGTAMIEELVAVHFPDEDIGFSQPISHSLELGDVQLHNFQCHKMYSYYLVLTFFSSPSFKEISVDKSTAS